jgi:hypothetical protein
MMTAVAAVGGEEATVQICDVAAENNYLNHDFIKTFLQKFYL